MIVIIVVICVMMEVIHKFLKKESVLYQLFQKMEKKMEINILYITDTSYVFYFLGKLNDYVINIDEEEKHGKFSKRLHKISGNLLLIINFTKLEHQKSLSIIKSLTSFSNLKGNTLITYVPYRAKESASLIALAGKTLVMGNYAVITNTKIDPVLVKLLEIYYGTSNTKKITENFFSEQNNDTHYSSNDLAKIKLSSFSEENISGHFNNINKENLVNLMKGIDDFF